MNKSLLGVILFLCGSSLLLRWAGVLAYTSEEICGASLALLGILSINSSFGSNNKRMILVSTILFLAGIIFIIKEYFEILDYPGLVFVSILFICGAVFLLLFINSQKEKVFLYTGLLLIAMSYISIEVLRPIGLFELTNKIDNLFSIVWPILLIGFGITLFISRKK